MKNQHLLTNLNNLDDNTFFSEIIMPENLNLKKSLFLNYLICYPNSSLNLLLKEKIKALKENEIKSELEKNEITNEYFKNFLSNSNLLEKEEKKLNKDEHLFIVSEINNPELKSTEDNISDNNTSSSKKITNKNNNIFSTKYYNNRGKKPEKKAKIFLNKKHNREDFDNLQTKIQVHCINFLINFVNDIVHTIFNSSNISFKDINYEAKKRINHSYIIKLFQNPIKDIIIEKITKKYKTLNKQLDYNKKLYEQLTEKSIWFKDFLEMKYINFFRLYYYYQEKPLKVVTINGKTISVSNNTKSFHYLLDEQKVLNKKINDLVKNVYFNGYNKDKPFITTKCDK